MRQSRELYCTGDYPQKSSGDKQSTNPVNWLDNSSPLGRSIPRETLRSDKQGDPSSSTDAILSQHNSSRFRQTLRDGLEGQKRLKRKIETPERSTTPDYGALHKVREFATRYNASGIPKGRKDFDPEDKLLQEDLERLKREGLHGKALILEPPDDTYYCHLLTFYNGRKGPKVPMRKIESFSEILGTKKDFQNNPSLYDELNKRLAKNKDSCFVLYMRNGRLVHSSPILDAYQDPEKGGERSIRLYGKWGSLRSLFLHDIENVPLGYKDQGNTNWQVRFTDREKGRILD